MQGLLVSKIQGEEKRPYVGQQPIPRSFTVPRLIKERDARKRGEDAVYCAGENGAGISSLFCCER
jgi:hypothetical protein